MVGRDGTRETPETGGGRPAGGATAPTPDVLRGVQRRDPAAMTAFFEGCFDTVYGLAFRMLGERASAEDLTHEVFLRVHRSAETIDPERDPLPWLRTITANLCRDHWRSFESKVRTRSVPIEDHAEEGVALRNGGPTPEAHALAGERERLVQRAIGELPEQLREVVVLRDYEGLDHESIADVVGASGAAVRKRYSRALAMLGELLQDDLP